MTIEGTTSIGDVSSVDLLHRCYYLDYIDGITYPDSMEINPNEYKMNKVHNTSNISERL